MKKLNFDKILDEAMSGKFPLLLAAVCFVWSCSFKESFQYEERPSRFMNLGLRQQFIDQCSVSDQKYDVSLTLQFLRKIAKKENCEAIYNAVNELESIDFGFPRSSSKVDLSLLTLLPHLRTLTMRRVEAQDWSQLSMLSALRRLTLSENRFSQTQVLETLVNLEILDLSSNSVDNLEPLKGLSNLRELTLAHNEITSVETLSTLGELKILDLSHNQIASAYVLAALKNLERLYLDHNPIADYAFLQSMESLDTIYYDVLDFDAVPEDLRPKWVRLEE